LLSSLPAEDFKISRVLTHSANDIGQETKLTKGTAQS
jgi:hypothetical protein